MNLLKDPWIPVREGATFRQVTYKEILCTEKPDMHVALPRDDLELACIQMLAALTQVIFMPKDRKELRERVKTPLAESVYDCSIEKYVEWFDLDHPRWPFMQSVNTGTDAPTPIQKLFPGLPAGNNHAFFNDPGELNIVCTSCAAIGLFNLCTHTPNLSGRHMGGLRGNAPVSTMIYDREVRKMVWMNVLTQATAERLFALETEDKPVWVEPIIGGSSFPAASIGLARGLFWTPILVKLQITKEKAVCDCCGTFINVGIRSFLLGSDFKFGVIGLWPHPYSPRQLNVQKETKKGREKPEESIVSFRSTKPAWTQFTEFLFESTKSENKPGYAPAAVVAQYHEVCSDRPIDLLVGGYRNKQAAILQRRHELYSMPAGWNGELRGRITEIVEIGLLAEELLSDKALYPVVKGNKEKGIKGVGSPINVKASELFFYFTEPIIHRMLRETSLKDYVSARNTFLKDLSRICFQIFDRVTAPYVHKPELVGTVAIARDKLRMLLKRLTDKHTVVGGNS